CRCGTPPSPSASSASPVPRRCEATYERRGVMIDDHHYEKGQVKEFKADDISKLVGDPHLLWVDVDNPSDADLECLQHEFSLHPLAMEDVREHHQRPKLEKYPTHAFIVAYSADLQEIDIFVGPSWVI